MVKNGIIVQPTDWAHPIVVVPKANGEIRICIDPRNLNKYIRKEHFKIPTQEKLFLYLSGAKVFFRILID